MRAIFHIHRLGAKRRDPRFDHLGRDLDFRFGRASCIGSRSGGHTRFRHWCVNDIIGIIFQASHPLTGRSHETRSEGGVGFGACGRGFATPVPRAAPGHRSRALRPAARSSLMGRGSAGRRWRHATEPPSEARPGVGKIRSRAPRGARAAITRNAARCGWPRLSARGSPQRSRGECNPGIAAPQRTSAMKLARFPSPLANEGKRARGRLSALPALGNNPQTVTTTP